MYISSYNIISSLGFCLENNLKNIKKGKTGIEINNDKQILHKPVNISLVNTEKLDYFFSKLDKTENYTRFEKLLILSVSEALKKSKISVADKKTILIISTTKGSIDLIEKNKKILFEPNRIQLWKSAEIVKDFFKNPNKAIIISNACISGVLGIIVAKRLLENKFYENAIIVGADIISKFIISGFQSFKAISSEPCKPFDKNRNGMTPGEGAGTIIVTNDKSKAKSDKIIISGAANTNDANHISGSSRTGKELAFAIKKATENAASDLQKINYISAHGTATLYNDESETKALNLCGLSQIPTNSFKGFFGHTFGAAGIIETVLAISSIENNFLYKSLGFSNQGTEKKINIIKENQNAKINTVLKIASGFGGCNAAIIIRKTNSENKNKTANKNFQTKIINKVSIKNKAVKINDKTNFEFQNNNLSAALKSVYKNYKIKYPKFYKMDSLSKIAFLTSEILLKNTSVKKYKSDEIAVVFSNGSSSLQTDLKYQQTINDHKNYFPSPSIFVYTLANIMVGEICIRNKIKGENIVFISKNFDKEFLFQYVNILFHSGKTKICIAGRVEHNYPSGNYEAVLYLIEKIEI